MLSSVPFPFLLPTTAVIPNYSHIPSIVRAVLYDPQRSLIDAAAPSHPRTPGLFHTRDVGRDTADTARSGPRPAAVDSKPAPDTHAVADVLVGPDVDDDL